MSRPPAEPGTLVPAVENRRQFPRVLVNRTAYLHTADATGVCVHLCDVSPGGLSFTSDRPRTAGDRIELTPGPDAAAGPRVGATVSWVVSNAMTGLCRAGCTWDRELTEDEMWAFT